ncbi:MAG: 23S rRNA (uracil(1939)-C(5))-methyltransferase RlmD [Paludibacteraceae bacterium]|nr:23S rRNA (uracil(1939)-C(5))-methyltransferase RlmD [Paludibacteraceae bacterium]
MARNKKQLPILTNITIEDVANEGKALAHVDGIVVFTQYAVPGDVVDIQVTKKKHNYMEGRVVAFHSYSEKRCEAFCSHYGTCGGCKWQILPYEEQIKYKQKQVEAALTHVGKVQLPEISPILGSAKTIAYRNKLEFTFSNKRWLTPDEMENTPADAPKQMNGVGFHIPGMFDKVLDINHCSLQDDINNRLRNEIRRYALENGLEFFDLRNQTGFLRTMMVRTTSTGQLMLLLVFYQDLKAERVALLDHLLKTFPEITSLQYVINSKCNDTITDQEVILYYGTEALLEEMEGLKFKISPKSFYQTNSEQAYELYKVARNFAELTGNEVVYDLYTGTGTIANFVSRQAKKVIGIEYVPEAIEDAKINSQFNGIDNTDFYAGDMKDILTDAFIAKHGQPDVIITDPPRAGMHTDVINVILNARPRRIVYVSCNPVTQARDLELLDVAYRVDAVQPVDMFPHTHHVENVVKLTLRDLDAQ